ncbi:DUF4236 domain-containing protein [Sphingomonas abietis]|uniref:DUF4236 domain-containing protein n=1 Tax=Sphingomonas abietis TaxID=3012344 RepID=A0ABY7NV74_9SPHN|nr:DUF4236 domain-containing protein [Sphingomonas abietis]WBO24316.1 DUF4236 domain-containing protein [Sphingomonas abietis]
MSIVPGVRLNFSKSGVSTSIGGHGATVNLSKRGTRTTIGIPGSGLSYSTLTPHAPHLPGAVAGQQTKSNGAGWIAGIGAVIVLGAVGLYSASPRTAPGTAPQAVQAPSFVNTLSLNCRSAPGSGGSVVRTLERGTAVTASAASGVWSKVSSPGTADCWALSRFLSTDAPISTPYQGNSRASGGHGPRLARNAAPLGAAGARSYALHRHRVIHHPRGTSASGCSCGGGGVCIGPRGGRYCITSGGNKRYGV